jgi:hypothetical protein
VPKNIQRLALAVALMTGGLLMLSAPANAATNQISGTALLDTAGPARQCPAEPTGYEDFPAIVMTGSLDGCWYTNILTKKETPSGAYLETGEELFVGRLDGGPAGTFTTTYRFEAKLNPDGSEVRGRCQHPIAKGSGTGGFAGATGRVDFKDIVGDPTTYVYRGHISVS